MLVAEFGTDQVFWSLLWLCFFVIWVVTIIAVFADVVRADDLSGRAKAGWTAVVVFVPIIGALIYLIVNGQAMGLRASGIPGIDPPTPSADTADESAQDPSAPSRP